MSHTIKTKGGDAQVKTFHGEASPEVRATVLAGGKRVDFHVFIEDNAQVAALTLGQLLAIASGNQFADGAKIEIGAANVADFAPAEKK